MVSASCYNILADKPWWKLNPKLLLKLLKIIIIIIVIVIVIVIVIIININIIIVDSIQTWDK